MDEIIIKAIKNGLATAEDFRRAREEQPPEPSQSPRSWGAVRPRCESFLEIAREYSGECRTPADRQQQKRNLN
jgi:hypothetical protein